MAETDTRKVALGTLLLAISSVLILGTGVGSLGSTVPVAAVTVAAFGLAAGAVLIGTSDPGRPV